MVVYYVGVAAELSGIYLLVSPRGFRFLPATKETFKKRSPGAGGLFVFPVTPNVGT
jgi:hypothetical protein